MALTKKQEQELRAAQAEEARIKKLEEQLEAARAKVAARSANRQKEILSAIRRKKVARQAQLTLIEKASAAIDTIDHDIRVLEDSLDDTPAVLEED